ncbi:MAG: DUF4358 domain-containing protein [Mollicutes bacterium]|nr:DUF4358 domain-containing protein [Mollicutes bacterium]
MKKYLIILILITLAITGCKKESEVSLDIYEASKALDIKYTNMNSMDEGELAIIYELDLKDIENKIIKASSLNNGDFYAFICTNKSEKQKIKEQMMNMFEILEQQSNLYSPEAVKKIQNRLETSIGECLIYIVSDNNDAYYKVVKEHVS